jgi:hypothetical protein
VHRAEVLITRGAEGRTSKAFVGHMTEEKSLELASKIAAEGFVFFVGFFWAALTYWLAVHSICSCKPQQRGRFLLIPGKELTLI